MNRPLYIEPNNNKPHTFVLLFIGLLVGLIIVLSCGCSRKACPPAAEIKVHDTVTVTRQVRYRDTAITVPGAGVSTLLRFGSTQQWSTANNYLYPGETVIRDLRNKQAHLKVTQSASGDLSIDCNCDSVVKQARLRDSLINVSQRHSETKTVVVEKKYVPLIVEILAWAGGICLFVVLAYLTKKFWLK